MKRINWKRRGAYSSLGNQSLEEWMIQNHHGQGAKAMQSLIADIVGIPEDTIRTAVRRQFEKLGLHASNEYISQTIKAALQRKRAAIKIEKPRRHVPDVDTLYEQYVALQKTQRAMWQSESDITVTVEGDLPVAIVFMSDWHIGPIGVDLEALDADIDFIVHTPRMYAYVGGDSAQNMIVSVIQHFGRLDPDMAISDQWLLVWRFLNKLRPALVAVGSGNHDVWTIHQVQEDTMRRICRELNVVYTGQGGLLRLKVGTQEYVVFRRHKYRYGSSFNLTHTCKRLWEFSPVPFDVGVIEHGHDPAIEPFMRHGLERIAVRTGTYLVESPFADEHGLVWRKGTPVVVFDPKERLMTPFMSLQGAVKFLEGYGVGGSITG